MKAGDRMGFTFKQRPALEICGKQYEVDLTDVGFIEAVVTDFSAIIREYDTLTGMRETLSTDRTAELSAEACREMSRQLTDCSRRLVALSRGFIEKTLGEEAYAELFAKRKPNSAEHIELCAYLYEAAIQSREGVVNRYVLPGTPNRRARRTAKKPDGGSKKSSD